MSAHGCIAIPCPLCVGKAMTVEPAYFTHEPPVAEQVAAERERLKSLVLDLLKDGTFPGWRSELAKMFEVKP